MKSREHARTNDVRGEITRAPRLLSSRLLAPDATIILADIHSRSIVKEMSARLFVETNSLGTNPSLYVESHHPTADELLDWMQITLDGVVAGSKVDDLGSSRPDRGAGYGVQAVLLQIGYLIAVAFCVF